jgi:hypothetical protein
LSQLSELPPRERARRYRELAREARQHAANAKAEEQAAFVRYAGKWEQLAPEAEAEAKAKTAKGS